MNLEISSYIENITNLDFQIAQQLIPSKTKLVAIGAISLSALAFSKNVDCTKIKTKINEIYLSTQQQISKTACKIKIIKDKFLNIYSEYRKLWSNRFYTMATIHILAISLIGGLLIASNSDSENLNKILTNKQDASAPSDVLKVSDQTTQDSSKSSKALGIAKKAIGKIAEKSVSGLKHMRNKIRNIGSNVFHYIERKFESYESTGYVYDNGFNIWAESVAMPLSKEKEDES